MYENDRQTPTIRPCLFIPSKCGTMSISWRHHSVSRCQVDILYITWRRCYFMVCICISHLYMRKKLIKRIFCMKCSILFSFFIALIEEGMVNQLSGNFFFSFFLFFFVQTDSKTLQRSGAFINY